MTQPIGDGLTSNIAPVAGAELHFVRAGAGPLLVLLHGFPQDWSEYRSIMPQLAQRFTVVAIDLRGIGRSSVTAGGYDAATMAEDIHQLIVNLRLPRAYVVGHDIGGMVAYAFALRYPELTRGAMLMDCAIPGIEGWEKAQGGPAFWHVNFMQVPGLAEKLVTGREADFLRYFYGFGKFTPTDVGRYLKAYATPDQLRAALEIYRALPKNAEFNSTNTKPSRVPLFVVTGSDSPFKPLVPQIVEGLRIKGFSSVDTGEVANSIHYLVEDQPKLVADLIERVANSS